MAIPTEPVGSIPRPAELLAAMQAHAAGKISTEQFRNAQDAALARYHRAIGRNRFARNYRRRADQAELCGTYPLTGRSNLAAEGVVIPFADGHTRQLPKLTGGPFRTTVCMPVRI